MMRQILIDNTLKPDRHSEFAYLLDVEVGTEITAKNLGQCPKYFGKGYQGSKFVVTEQMMKIWSILKEDSEYSIKKVLSSPMGVGKSYLAWFLAANAYVNGWLMLYIADASILKLENSNLVYLHICQRFFALNRDILTAPQLS